jgi:hypothetical protein
MGTITRSFANNITTSGVLLPASLVNNSIANVTAYNASVATGNMVLISSQTASASASISFTTGIDSTYKEYQFYFINMHPNNNNYDFRFQVSTDGGSNYATTLTSTVFDAYQDEAGTVTTLEYRTPADLAQDTSFQSLSAYVLGNDNDGSLSGSMSLFNPASTTYVKHFIANTQETNGTGAGVYSVNSFVAGYFNTTSAVNAVRFQMASGNIDDGTILMFGIK